MTDREFIKKYAAAMLEPTIGTNLFPSVTIAQALLEGAAGRSALARQHHNHYGIKAGTSWKGLTYFVSTGEQTIAGKKYTIKDYFRSYASDYDCFRDRVKVLSLPRYKLVHLAKTPEKQAQALKDAGYATDVLYRQKIMQLIKEHGLLLYDEKKKPC